MMLYVKNENENENQIIVNNLLFEQIFINDNNNELFYFKFTKLFSKETIYQSDSFTVNHLKENEYIGLISNLLYLINKKIFDLGDIFNIELRRIINEIQLFYREIDKHNIHSFHDLRSFEIVPSHTLVMNNGKDFIIINDINQIKNKIFHVEIYRGGLYYYYNLVFRKTMTIPLIFNYLNKVKSYNFVKIEDCLYRGYDNIRLKNNLKKEIKKFYDELLYNMS